MNVKNLVLGVGIFIVFMLMLGYGIEAFYASPKYDTYCGGKNFAQPYPAYPTDITKNCTFSPALQQAQDSCYADGGQPVFDYDSSGCYSGLKECNMCSKEFENANKEYSKVIFIIALIVGLITLFIGYSILSIEPVGSSLLASGIGSIFYGSVRNWQNFSDVWRFFLLFAALALLIWIALRLNKNASSANKAKK